MKTTTTHYDISKSAYPYLVTIFCSIIILGNIYALKITTFFSILTPCGMICFPFTFAICDIITEGYGEDAANTAIRLGLISLVIFFITLNIVTNLEPAPGWEHQEAWETIFALSPRIFVATFLAFYFGEKINSKILSILQYIFRGAFFLRRSIASTFIGVTVDTLIFNIIAFSFIFSFGFFVKFTLHQLAIKLVFELFGSWLASLIVPYIQKNENLNPVKPRAWITKYFSQK